MTYGGFFVMHFVTVKKSVLFSYMMSCELSLWVQ